MRTARLDHDPLARPAPITLGWVPRPQVAKPDNNAPATRLLLDGCGQAKTAKANWSEVVRRIVQRSGMSQAAIARYCGVNATTSSKWTVGKTIPGPLSAQKLTELWAKHVGGSLP